MALKRFRVLRGTLSEDGKTYRQGDVIETEKDLTKHNFGPSSEKFLLLDNKTPVEPSGSSEDPSNDTEEFTKEELEQMTVADLRRFAEEEEIDLEGASRKDEIINRLLS